MITTINFWYKALITIPRVSKEEWLRLDVISKWLVATRASVLIMTSISVIIGGLLAYAYESFNWIYFIVCFLGINLAHAANNLINDWVDFRKGVDKGNYFRALYGPQILEHKYVTESTFFKYVAVTLLLGLLAGLYLVSVGNTNTWYFLLVGLFFLLFYTWPLKYLGLGEPAVVLVWGPLMIGGTYFVVSGNQWNPDVAFLALIYAIGPTSVLFGKHIDKLSQDKAKGVKTLPVILGEKYARYSVVALWILQYVAILYLVISSTFSPVLLLVFIAIPLLITTFKYFSVSRPSEKPESYEAEAWPLYLVRYAFVYNKRFSVLLMLGILLHVVQVKLGYF